jgi:hypothetical protein
MGLRVADQLHEMDLAAPKERAEQMVLQQGEPAETFEWFKVNMAGNLPNQGVKLISELEISAASDVSEQK